MRDIFLFVVVVILLGAASLYMHAQKNSIPAPGQAAHFSSNGILHFPAPATGQAVGSFEYIQNRASTTKSLMFDASSICAAPNGSLPCMAMNITFNVPFDGKSATVDGIVSGDSIVVGKLTIPASTSSVVTP